MMNNTKNVLLGAALLMLAAGCNKEKVGGDESLQYVSMTVSLSTNETQSRARVDYVPQDYPGRYYLFGASSNESGYSCEKEGVLTTKDLVIDSLVPSRKYKLVLMAIPKGQTPELPELGMSSDDGSGSTYETAWVNYLDGSTASSVPTGSDIYRDVLSFQASTSSAQQNAVLTRQNGAVEVRIKNKPNMKKVTLIVPSPVAMALNDGTGGQVLQPENNNEIVKVIKELNENLNKPEVRIKVNVLPQEDITYNENTQTGGLLIIEYNNGVPTDKIPLKTSRTIPVYPNQVTWLTLGEDGEGFEVNFSGNINLENPDDWDGWIPNPNH